MTLRVAIMISGRGSNMEALIRHAQRDDVPAEVSLVLADKDAPGLKIASALGVATDTIMRTDYDSTEEHEAAIITALDNVGIGVGVRADAIFLAGYMRLLSPKFCRHYEGRLFNIHPSLLPRHKGLNTHAKAIKAGDKTHGCSVHLVTERIDDGPVLDYREVDVHSNEKAEALAKRVLDQEHRLYPSILDKLATGEILVRDGSSIRPHCPIPN
jgi:phosphoribosylglycinamide formyltransferase-1